MTAGSSSGEPATAVATVAASGPQSLSQFIAKVLDQLSLSAWLPSAALVMAVTVLVHADGADGDFGAWAEAVSKWDITDGLLLLGAVIVLTTVTQAFEFEAIQLLEGYWGPAVLSELACDVGCSWHRWYRGRLESRQKKWTVRAFTPAHFQLSLLTSSTNPPATARDLEILLGQYAGGTARPANRAEMLRAIDVPWRNYAPARPLRREQSLRRRLELYPDADKVLPTRLGNTLRSFEDRAFPDLRGETLAGAVQRVYHKLPAPLQRQHDEHRTRLDVYASLVATAIVVTVYGVVILWEHRGEAGAVAAIGLITAYVFYRSCIAAARGYGSVLLVIGRY